MSFLEELAKKGLIKESQIDEIRNRAREKYDGDVDDVLSEMKIPEDQILELKGAYFSMPIRRLGNGNLSFDALKYVSEDSATHYHFAPIGLVDGVLEVGVTDPGNMEAMDALQFISSKIGIPFKIFLILKSDYKKVMDSYRGIAPQVQEAIAQFDKDDDADSLKQREFLNKGLKDVKAGEEKKIVEDAPIIKIVAVILRNAIEGNASDIHIENTGEKVKVRYRVDGTLHTTIVLPPNVYNGCLLYTSPSPRD